MVKQQQCSKKQLLLSSLVFFFLVSCVIYYVQISTESNTTANNEVKESGYVMAPPAEVTALDLAPLPILVPKPPPKPVEMSFLSQNCPVYADVRGNLAPASIVTQYTAPALTADMTTEQVKAVTDAHWLSGRWQAAADMSGTPIPGQHWLVLDLQGDNCTTLQPSPPKIAKIVLEWEDAFSKDYVVQSCTVPIEDSCDACALHDWKLLAASTAFTEIRRKPRHIKTQLVIGGTSGGKQWQYNSQSSDAGAIGLGAGLEYPAHRCLRLVIIKPATRWGASLWQMEVWGYPAA